MAADITINGRHEFERAVLTDGTVLTSVTTERFSGHDTTVWFLGGNEEGHWVYAPAHAVVRLEV